MRLFISLAVDPGLSRKIFQQFQGLNLPWDKIKTVQSGQLHLTLKFLGDTPMEKLPTLIEALQTVESKTDIIELFIDGTVIFNQRRPQTLVLHLKENQDLQNLFNNTEKALFQAGLAHKERRRYSPHLTLARVKQATKFAELSNFSNWKLKASFSVSYFTLQQSVLTSKGPEYTVLQTFDL